MNALTQSTSVSKLRSIAQRATSKVKNIAENNEKAIDSGIAMAATTGTAFGFGYANARWGENGELKFIGMPVDLMTGIGLNGIAFVGMLGKYDFLGHAIGNGAGSSFAYRMGAQLGAQAKSDSTSTKGLPGGGGTVWTRDEQGRAIPVAA